MDEILPPGFEKQVDNRGRTFYIDHNTQSTHWKLPKVMNIRYIYMPPSYSHILERPVLLLHANP